MLLNTNPGQPGPMSNSSHSESQDLNNSFNTTVPAEPAGTSHSVITKDLYDQYGSNGYVVTFTRGYKPELNPARHKDPKTGSYCAQEGAVADYQTAKIPFEKDWQNKPTKTFDECVAHMQNGGWIGVVLPANVIALDIDGKKKDPEGYAQKMEAFLHVIDKLGIKDRVGIHITNDGVHAIFKADNGFEELVSTPDGISMCGIPVTYRAGRGKSTTQLVIAPSNNRTWERFVPTNELAELPAELRPDKEKSLVRGETKVPPVNHVTEETRSAPDAKKAKILETGRKLGQAVRAAYNAGQIGGHNDIELAFFAWLALDCGNDLELIENVFEPIQDGAGTAKRVADLKRLYELKTKEAPIMGAGTWFGILKENNLDSLTSICRKYQKLFPNVVLPTGLLTEEQLKLNIIGYNNSRSILIWTAGRIHELKISDITSHMYQLLTGVDVVDPKAWA
ncbi:MAG TPA: hypothetical protein PKG81_07570, partial [Candidatus Omnitrophota bacterium]|nr:hypothetical protein [Candidatus Omnitrophota bacterium]